MNTSFICKCLLLVNILSTYSVDADISELLQQEKGYSCINSGDSERSSDGTILVLSANGAGGYLANHILDGLSSSVEINPNQGRIHGFPITVSGMVKEKFQIGHNNSCQEIKHKWKEIKDLIDEEGRTNASEIWKQRIESLILATCGTCLTFIELPALFNNDDIVDTALQLTKRCYGKAFLHIDWNQWEDTKNSEELKVLLHFMKLMATIHGDSFRLSTKFVVFKENNQVDVTNQDIVKELNDALRDFFLSGIQPSDVS